MLLYSESHSGVFSSTAQGWQEGWALLVDTYLLQVNHVRPWPWEMAPAFSWRAYNTHGGTVTCGYQEGCQPCAYP